MVSCVSSSLHPTATGLTQTSSLPAGLLVTETSAQEAEMRHSSIIKYMRGCFACGSRTELGSRASDEMVPSAFTKKVPVDFSDLR